MSLIAEALKKAEQQQRLAPVPAAVQPAAPARGTPTDRISRWIWFSVFLLATTTAGFLWWAGSRKPSPITEPIHSPEPLPQPVTTELPAPAVVPPANEELPPVLPEETGEIQPADAAPPPVLSLSGIVRGAVAKDSFVLINNKTLREGDRIEGLTVISIGEKDIELRNESGEVQFLTLES